ncbi:MAG TPA: hypothetical protein VJU86_13865 [Pyrinomonadaceae bacterium]|nr:hypothetical protein [Pyrinomonadaceae bacterium]
MKFIDKFIAFVDVLGFKSLVEASEAGTGMPLVELLELLENLGSGDERLNFGKHGPTCCPNSSYLQRNLDFRVTQISDCVIVSAEISPAGLINLIHHCWGATMMLLKLGIMCRGYITQGTIYHTEKHVIGSGYQNAYAAESAVSFKRAADERGTPFVELDRAVYDYVQQCQDNCVTEMFSRFVRREGEAAALFPFQALSHSFLVSGDRKFNPQEERRANQDTRLMLKRVRTRVMDFIDPSSPSAIQKAAHYLSAIDAQLIVCDKKDEEIEALTSPI